jgi:hypothetical protein
MPYTNNVPQANQTIASTTTPIRNNFAFIQTDAQVEHSFNGNSIQAEGTHLKASMGNIALSPALPSGTNGTYFVSGGKAYFYDGTTNFLLSSTFPVNAAVNFNGISGAVIRSSFNVASVVRNSTGKYTINFTTPLATNNYVVFGMGMRNGSNQVANVDIQSDPTYGNSMSTNFVIINTFSESGAYQDVLMCSVIVMGE